MKKCKTLIDNLKNYTDYSKGDLSKECTLSYQDITVEKFDFSKFDLNNSYFGGVTFDECDFSEVYLSGSNFGGSLFKKCSFYKNELKKASWDDIIMDHSSLNLLNAFRTTFMYGRFDETQFWGCIFENIIFDNSNFTKVVFNECSFVDTDFSKCVFDETYFLNCKFENVKFEGVDYMPQIL